MTRFSSDNVHISGDMSIDWLIALFSRLVDHDNMQVKKFGVLYILRLDYSLYPEFTEAKSLPVSKVCYFMTAAFFALAHSVL